MKYHLLLQDILKYTIRCDEPTETLTQAIDMMKTIPKAANNMMEVGRIQGFEVIITSFPPAQTGSYETGLSSMDNYL